MRMTLCSALVALAALTAFPAAAQQRIVPASSEIGFVSKQMGVPVEGRFRRFDAQLAFDPKRLDAARIGLRIDMGSATLGSEELEVEIVKPEWFHAKSHPHATFESTGMRSVGAGKYEVSGKLAIKGAVRDIVVPVTITQLGAATTATGAFAIKRLAFKIGDGDWSDTSMVADDVQVRFKLTLTGVAPI